MSYLIIGPHAWGRGDTFVEALRQISSQDADIHNWKVLRVPPGASLASVDVRGNITWQWEEDADDTREPEEVDVAEFADELRDLVYEKLEDAVLALQRLENAEPSDELRERYAVMWGEVERMTLNLS